MGQLVSGGWAMGAEKKKAAKKKKYATPTGEFRHADGDRRHRDTMGKAVRDALQHKKLLKQIGAVDRPEEEETKE